MLEQYANNIILNSIEENKDKLDNSKISVIHPEISIKYSSINVFLGKQGTGKTFTLYKELLKLSMIDSNVHLIIIATKDNRKDVTFELFRDKIDIPLITVSYENIIEFINNIIFYKLIYEYIISENLMDKIEDEQKNEVLTFLHLDNFGKSSLQEVIIFDDAAYQEIITKKPDIINIIHQVRHYKLIFCFCVQGIKAIPLPIKEQMTTLFIFPGFINQKLTTIFQQSGITELEYEEFKQIYRNLNNRDYIIVNCQTGNIEIIDGKI